MSPELLNAGLPGHEDSKPTEHSDFYALGMVIFEVLSGEVPLAQYGNIAVVWKIMQGEHPKRPKETWFPDDLWGILEQCWSFKPEERPPVGCVLEFLARTSISTPQRLISRSFSQDELPSLLEAMFSSKETLDIVQCLQGSWAQVIIDVLDEARHCDI